MAMKQEYEKELLDLIEWKKYVINDLSLKVISALNQMNNKIVNKKIDDELWNIKIDKKFEQYPRGLSLSREAENEFTISAHHSHCDWRIKIARLWAPYDTDIPWLKRQEGKRNRLIVAPIIDNVQKQREYQRQEITKLYNFITNHDLIVEKYNKAVQEIENLTESVPAEARDTCKYDFNGVYCKIR